MSGSNSAASIIPYIDATGMHIPTYEDVLNYYQQAFLAIYGADTYIENDSQDGQIIALYALGYYNLCVQMLIVFNSFSPLSAQGTALSSLVKINGMTRAIATQSQVDLLLGGTPGTEIINGYATDANNNQWNFPALVTITNTTFVLITAFCSTEGNVLAGPGSIITKGTPTRGWDTVTNPSAAVPGAPVETDPYLRARQVISVALPSQSIMDGIRGLVASVPGVVTSRGYENDTDFVDVNGQPPHCIYFVVDGGDPGDIATAINLKKTAGTPTEGTTIVTILNAYGLPKMIKYYVATQVPITMIITIQSLTDYTSQTGVDLVNAILTYGQAYVGIGIDLFISRFIAVATMYNAAEANSYNVKSVAIGRDGNAPAAVDCVIAFNEIPVFTLAAITLTVL